MYWGQYLICTKWWYTTVKNTDWESPINFFIYLMTCLTVFKWRLPDSQPDSLNELYCRFDKDRDDALIQPTGIKPPVAPPFVIQEDEVRRLLKKQNCRKAAGPDLVSSATIKHCADELTQVVTDIFNWSQRECRTPHVLSQLLLFLCPRSPASLV